ncbi:HepT-like ribonuclease domain-containing protein [Deinococcus peraridilitoris]|uniref:Polymerase nucleotidyl transferase domain-containing protein n=1 Tax=Deinococcus peraridilitoris (strain DSM 19664 / LMG 22246 / CIP 109416 / KR-200) TaxID=937777 RepID=L0A5V4_DEIPD|nr:HepT-like ribonuclease domain-containing protein [Deinococcus peraridilitoris]AFZ68547.1 hypothetical protein Deipe_3101 [Deinococcus peraridilitoris DSM 19664]
MPLVKLADAVALLRVHREEWDDGSLADLSVFGSVAHDQARPESDVDFLLTFARPVGLLHLVRFKLIFEDILQRRVDVVTPGGLKSALRADVLADALSVTGEAQARGAPRVKRWRWRVQEMQAALGRIGRYTTGLTVEDFEQSELVRDAVLHNLLVVGESVAYLPEEVRLLHPDLPWDELRQVRHLIAHDYFGLDVQLLWHTVTVELPALAPQLARVIEKRAPTPP